MTLARGGPRVAGTCWRPRVQLVATMGTPMRKVAAAVVMIALGAVTALAPGTGTASASSPPGLGPSPRNCIWSARTISNLNPGTPNGGQYCTELSPSDGFSMVLGAVKGYGAWSAISDSAPKVVQNEGSGYFQAEEAGSARLSSTAPVCNPRYRTSCVAESYITFAVTVYVVSYAGS